MIKKNSMNYQGDYRTKDAEAKIAQRLANLRKKHEVAGVGTG
jgi:hypothetical protein